MRLLYSRVVKAFRIPDDGCCCLISWETSNGLLHDIITEVPRMFGTHSKSKIEKFLLRIIPDITFWSEMTVPMNWRCKPSPASKRVSNMGRAASYKDMATSNRVRSPVYTRACRRSETAAPSLQAPGKCSLTRKIAIRGHNVGIVVDHVHLHKGNELL
jgi:hypothetical protein